MSASYFNLLKYAATGIASPDMTYFDKMRASTLMGGVVQTLTGQPPLSFKSDGTPLISWSMKGNVQQTGTPTPDNPVMPEFCGVRTGNLCDIGNFANTTTDTRSFLQLAIMCYYGSVFLGRATFSTGTDLLNINTTGNKQILFTITAENCNRLRIKHNGEKSDIFISNVYGAFSGNYVISFDCNGVNPTIIDGISLANIMLNSGSTALPYEPYGWAEKITCAGQTTPVYLGQTPSVRRVKKLVLTGEETTWRLTESGRIAVRIGTIVSIPDNASCFSTHFVGTSATSFANIGDGECSAQLSGSGGYREIGFYSTTYSTLEAFKQLVSDQYASGAPVTVWYVLAESQTGIVNEPLAKIGDYADELHSEDAAVTIPTVKGSNTLTVETDLQPSEMTITFKG